MSMIGYHGMNPNKLVLFHLVKEPKMDRVDLHYNGDNHPQQRRHY